MTLANLAYVYLLASRPMSHLIDRFCMDFKIAVLT
jgi:hypothetical protein